jgi:CRP-like cAMP-binding protein
MVNMDTMVDMAAQGVIAGTFACSEDVANVIAAKARLRHYAAQTIIIEGEAANTHVYLLVDGHARMIAYSVDGRLVAVEDYGTGELFGEGGVFEQPVAAHDVTAVGPVQAGAFSNPDFLALMNNYNSVALTVSRLLVRRLSKTTQRMVEGATLSAVGRIHAELLRQARAGENMTISPNPVLSSFALLVQSTRETVSRAISLLEKRGIIRRDEAGLTVMAPHRLQELIY